ncbi:MAG: UDP-N-acetylmuramate dehydrogenase [Parasporobacterium sp.]|nr:UDP-N-acetylmuramate dehydrogenase [Parasporobacterium sp.]
MNLRQEITEKIRKIAGDANVRVDEPMKDHTTMQVGGPAALFVTPGSEQEIVRILKLLKEERIPWYVLGNGSNVICRDEGYDGVILCLSGRFKGYEAKETEDGTVQVTVKAGTDNKEFAKEMADAGYAGFEFASGIPGSLGGATTMNAGAYDGEMKQIVQAVRILDPDGQIVLKSAEEMEFSYRHSLVSDGRSIVLETILALHRDEPAKIRERIADLTARREEKQPLEYPSCGSTFKRPEGYFAGKLISDAGLKGFRLGGAQVSEKHAGFVINREHASAKDVLDLVEHIQRTVKESQGVTLECEIKIL